jgi:hypothetical protein
VGKRGINDFAILCHYYPNSTITRLPPITEARPHGLDT